MKEPWNALHNVQHSTVRRAVHRTESFQGVSWLEVLVSRLATPGLPGVDLLSWLRHERFGDE
jgi:hypothetical protein